MKGPISVSGEDVVRLLELIGAGEVNDEAARELERLEAWVGHRLPAETRELLSRAPRLEHPDADHPELDPRFFASLPDVDAFMEALAGGHQARFEATCHFIGLYPIGAQLQYGDFMYPMVVIEPHTGEELGGVMYYDEREVGTWGATVSAFLLQSIGEFWTQVDEQRDGGDDEDDEEPEIDLDDLRDCFVLEGYDHRQRPPEAAELPAAIAEAWEPHWRRRLEARSRWWVCAMVAGAVQYISIDELPTEQQWQDEKSEVASSYHQAMYWLIAHLLLDNREELAEAKRLAAKNPSEGARHLLAWLEANPEAGERFAEAREALFEQVRRART